MRSAGLILIRTLFAALQRNSPRTAPLCLVLGEGSEAGSGRLTLEELKRSCLQRYGVEDALYIPGDLLDARIMELMRMPLTPGHREAFAEDLKMGIQAISPSDSHKVITLLAEQGIIKSLISTGFDTTIEKSQQELGLDVFQTYAPGVSAPYVQTGEAMVPNRPIHVKLRGDFHNYLHTGASPRSTHGDDDEPIAVLVQQIFQEHTLLFVGCSTLEPQLITALENRAEKERDIFYWCSPTPPPPILRRTMLQKGRSYTSQRALKEYSTRQEYRA